MGFTLYSWESRRRMTGRLGVEAPSPTGTTAAPHVSAFSLGVPHKNVWKKGALLVEKNV